MWRIVFHYLKKPSEFPIIETNEWTFIHIKDELLSQIRKVYQSYCKHTLLKHTQKKTKKINYLDVNILMSWTWGSKATSISTAIKLAQGNGWNQTLMRLEGRAAARYHLSQQHSICIIHFCCRIQIIVSLIHYISIIYGN